MQNQTAAIHYDTLPGTQIPENVTIGPVFYQGFDTFSELDAQYTYMANLAFNGSDHVQNALAETRHAVNAIRSNLESIEIGNEVDLYVSQRVRPPGWTEADWIREWHVIATAINDQILENNNASLDPAWIYQGLVFSAPDPYAGDNFTIAEAFQKGIDSGHNIKSVSVHSYMTGYTPATTLQASFLNHTEIVKNVSSWVAWKDYLAIHKPNVPLYIAEANSDPVTNTLPITYELQSVFGSALWKVDILMYAMSQSIPRYYVQQGTGFAFDSWQPIYINETVAPRVLPSWYGDIFIADVVGTASDVQVANIDLGRDTLTAYSVYVSGVLARYVLVNLEEWNSSTTYPRPRETISLSVPTYVTIAELSYLNAPGAESMTSITWAGQSWNYSAQAVSQVEVTGPSKSTMLNVQNGTVELTLHASEAALVTLQR